MNTKAVNSAAGVILAALTQNRTATGIALALDSAQLLMTPETAAELDRLRARVTELEQQLIVKDRPADEDPIAFSLTDKADAISPDQAHTGLGPRNRRLNEILARQRAAVEDPHDSPLHHPYLLGRELPQVGGTS